MSERPEQQLPQVDDAINDGGLSIVESASEDGGSLSPQDERVAELMSQTIDLPELASAVEQQEAADAADTLEDLEDHDAAVVLEQMDDQSAADALSEMQPSLAQGVLEDLIAEDRGQYAAMLLGMMAPDDAADMLQAIEQPEREQVLSLMSGQDAVNLRRLLRYGVETAGGVMTTDFLELRDDMTVGQAIERIRVRRLPEGVYKFFVTDEQHRLCGLVSLRDLLITDDIQPITDMMEGALKAVRPDVDREEVAQEFDRYDLSIMPVIDNEDRLLGVITVDDIIDIIRTEQTEDVQKTVGAGKEEAVYSGFGEKFRSRFPWLVVSLLIMTPSVIVVMRFENLIGELAILAVLMPVVAALAGNAGHQALAVTLRGIVLNEIRPDRLWPLVRREALIGLSTGLALGVVVAIVLGLLSLTIDDASWRLAVLVAVAMTVAMGVGTLTGAAIPLVMRRFGFDPAAASAIFLIMITDAVAFASLLGLAFLGREWILAAV